jgi:hypothetical protein
MRKLALAIVVLLLAHGLSAQVSYTLENEVVIFSFSIKNGKTAVLSKDKNNGYIIYRFGTKDKIELEYPKEKTSASWKKFTYSSYLRGGGIDNLGMDLNYIAFVNGDYKYVLYTTYVAEGGDESNLGIKVFDNKSDKLIANSKGKKSTWKGNLTVFRDSELINRDEEEILYD